MKQVQDWVIRCTHEASLHEKNIFLTLTFNNEALAVRENPGSLDKRDLQLFHKNLRYHSNQKFRYYACGEYGEKTGRPHYHVLLFGFEPEDKKLWKTSKNGHHLYESEFIYKCWPHGYANFGKVDWDSASYVAGYITKKFTKDQRLTWVDPLTGEIREKIPEFSLQSLKPGIGQRWIEKHYQDVFRDDYIVIKGKRRSVPRFYDKWLEKHHPEWAAEIKDKRQLEFLETPHITEERRLDMHLARWEHHTKRLTREVNNDDRSDFHDIRQQGQSIPEAILHAKRRYRFKDVTTDGVSES